MKNLILSEKLVSGAILAHQDAFVGIGHGLEIQLPPDVKNGDSWEIDITPFITPNRLATTFLGDQLFLTNEQELLSVIAGNLVQCNNSTSGTFDYADKPSKPHLNHRSEIIATHFSHIFLAKGRTLWWTDLDNYWNWYPSPESEADFRILEWEQDDITALVRLNEILYLHFPTKIYEVTYVGKPTIVRILERVHGAGSINSRCVQTHQSVQYFLGLDNFYLWSTDVGLKPIGQEIWEKFNSLGFDPNTIFSYHDRLHREICWVTSSHIFAFNYAEGHWAKYSSNSVCAHITSPTTSNFAPISSGSVATIAKVQNDGMVNLWVGDGCLLRDYRRGDRVEKCLRMETPYLETDDVSYGDLHFTKSVDLLVLDAGYGSPYGGLKVSVCGRERTSEKVRWSEVGVWRKNGSQGLLDFSPVVGKVIRFRFEVVSNLVTLSAGLAPNGGLRLDGKRLDVLNGEFKMDGTRLFYPYETVEMDGSVTLGELVYPREFHFELAGWGERVNLPQTLVGPDK